MDKYRKTNLALWNERTEIHAKSEYYDVEGFKAGRNSLHSIELEELGDVRGKSLLHLQCHFGMDTLSWTRLGATVTGADFSDKAIALAKSLSEELHIPARFVQTDIYELPNVLEDEFDIVFTSYGVLCWLPDMPRWGELVAHFLKPGGTFYIVEFHPTMYMFDDAEEITELRVAYSYFHKDEPDMWEVQGTYADREAPTTQNREYGWTHSLGDIVNALIDAGLRIEFLHEFPYCADKMLPMMEQDAEGWWRLPKYDDYLPLMFSLKATK